MYTVATRFKPDDITLVRRRPKLSASCEGKVLPSATVFVTSVPKMRAENKIKENVNRKHKINSIIQINITCIYFRKLLPSYVLDTILILFRLWIIGLLTVSDFSFIILNRILIIHFLDGIQLQCFQILSFSTIQFCQ